MNITLKQTGLPASYRKVAHIEVQVKFQKWVTLAHFRSSTEGQIDSYYVNNGNKVWEIGAAYYYNLIRFLYVGEKPPFGSWTEHALNALEL